MDSDFSSLKTLCDISVKFLPGLTKLMMSENTNLRMSLNINYEKTKSINQLKKEIFLNFDLNAAFKMKINSFYSTSLTLNEGLANVLMIEKNFITE